MGSNFGESRRGDGAGSTRLCEDNFGRMRKELPGHFVYRLVAKRSVNQQDLAAGEVFLKKARELARGGGIVGAIEINIGAGLKLFKSSRPDRPGNAFRDVVGRNAEPALRKIARGSQGVQSILQLEAAGQARGKVEGVARREFCNTSVKETVLRYLFCNLKCARGFNDRTA